MNVRVSVCIATYRRAERLLVLLDDLALQTRVPDEVVVIDNDVAESARAAITTARARGLKFDLIYDTQPERNIALTRNKTVAMSTGDWLAFIDDDERAPPEWLEKLLHAAQQFGADGVLGPVLPTLPEDAPDWIKRGAFYDFSRMKTGDVLELNLMRFGNVVLRGAPVRALPGPFDVSYALGTGEDGDMLLRMVYAGAKIIWCDEATVTEPIEPSRLSFRWLAQRAMSGGQEYARKALKGRYGELGLAGQCRLFADASLKLLMALMLAVFTLPLGRHRAAHWLIRAAANFGKLTVFFGWSYQEYAVASASGGTAPKPPSASG